MTQVETFPELVTIGDESFAVVPDLSQCDENTVDFWIGRITTPGVVPEPAFCCVEFGPNGPPGKLLNTDYGIDQHGPDVAAVAEAIERLPELRKLITNRAVSIQVRRMFLAHTGKTIGQAISEGGIGR